MPRIHTITTDTVITDNDMILGTDGAVGANNATKNFSFGVFKNYLLTEPTITGNLTVSGGEIILDNNRYLQGKLTSGSPIDLIGVKNNDIVTISNDAQEVHIGPLNSSTITQINGSLILVGAGVFNGALTVAGNTTLGNALTDTVTVAGDATFNRDVTITRNLTVNGTINLGDADTDNIIFGADVDSHILPDDNDTFNLGSSSKNWDTLFASRVELSSHAAVGGNLTVTGTTTLNGNSTFNAPITVGANGTGHAVTIHSASSGRALTYDPTDDTDGMSKLMFGENMKAQFGTNTADLAIYNNGTDSFIDAGTEAGKLYIRNKGTDRDIVFQAWAGAADTNPETYFLLDGSLAEDGSGSQTVNYTRWPEFASIAMGDVVNGGIEGAVLNTANGHFAIQHHIGTGVAEKNINVYNYSTDGDIEFFTNGMTSYLRLDGGQEKIFINQDVNPYAIKGATGQPGYLELKADNGANNSDHWKVSAEADNVFEIQTRDGGSYAPVVEMVASNKSSLFKGDINVAGTISNQHFTIPNAIGTASQILKVPSSGSILEWGDLPASVPFIDGGAEFTDSLIIGHSTHVGTLNAAERNVGVGNTVLEDLTTGDDNTVLGHAAGKGLTTGSDNTLIGAAAGYNIATADDVIAIGARAIGGSNGNTTGQQVVAIGNDTVKMGYQSGSNNIAGVTAVGHSAGERAQGFGSTFIGWNAGSTVTGYDSSGDYHNEELHSNSAHRCVIIGGNAGTSGVSVTNEIVIGFGAKGKGTNTVVIGNNATTSWLPHDDNGVDLGSTTESFKDAYIQGALKIGDTSGSTYFQLPSTIGTEAQVLKVPASGNTLEWGAADSIPHIREGANFGGSLLIGHTTTGTLNNALSNTALGIGVLASITEGDYNVAMGRDAADALTTGDQNVAIGMNALGAITTQGGNVAIGYGAGDTLTDTSHGSNNVFVGANAGGAIASGQGKTVFIGSSAGANNIKGQTTGVGWSALSKNEGNGNTAFGYGAGKNNVGGDSNTYIGTSTGEWAENNTTSDNTLVGAYSGKSTAFEGINNTTLGADAGYFMEECTNNVLIGRHAGRAIKNDSSNVIIGKDAAADNEHVGDQNVAIGTNALNNIDAGSAGVDTRNVVIGYSSGSTIISGTQNTLLGALTQPSANNTSNEIVIGYDVDGLGANKAVIGNASTTNIAPGGNNTASLGDDTRGFKELILSSPDGTKYRIKVSNAGALSATAV